MLIYASVQTNVFNAVVVVYYIYYLYCPVTEGTIIMGKAKKIKVSKKDEVKSAGPLGEQILRGEFALPSGMKWLFITYR